MAKRITEVETCPSCGGTGEIIYSNCEGSVTCPRCNGSGTVEVTYTQATNIFDVLFPDT